MKLKSSLQFLPRGKEGGGILPWVIAVMTYLSALSIASGFALHNMSDLWSSELAKSMTIQISNADSASIKTQTENVLEVLRNTPEVTDASVLSHEEITKLLEPWLGSGNVTDDLPIPAMITANLASERYVDLVALQGKLQEIAPDARLDGHQQWVEQLSKLSSTIQATSGLAVVLIMLTTIAIIVFATNARLSAHRENIEIVHLMGAEDKVISGEFKHRFMIYGFKGGVGGLVAAGLTIFIFYMLTKDLGDGLTPTLTLNLFQILTLGFVPFAVSFLSMVTADKAVKKALIELM